MKTRHKLYFQDSRSMKVIPSASVHLIATSPPYPMIEMWDEMFSNLNPDITAALSKDDGFLAFELMHSQLDPVWHEAHRILIDGGIAGINIGDATRTIGGDFILYPNHARILTAMIDAGFKSLPSCPDSNRDDRCRFHITADHIMAQTHQRSE
ncbi:MAG: DNA methyltransferase [Desulfobacterales bacterium]